MIELTFRRAREADLTILLAMLADDEITRSRKRTADEPDYPAAFAAISRDENQFLVVAEADAEIVGCMQLSFIPNLSPRGVWRCQIEGVRVAADHRGRGYGGQMMDWALSLARARGCRLAQLTTDKRRHDAHRFYERLGFVSSHEGMKLSPFPGRRTKRSSACSSAPAFPERAC